MSRKMFSEPVLGTQRSVAYAGICDLNVSYFSLSMINMLEFLVTRWSFFMLF